MAKKKTDEPFAGLASAMNSADAVKPEAPKTPKKVKTPTKKEKNFKFPATLPETDYHIMKDLMSVLEAKANFRSVSASKALRYALKTVDLKNIDQEKLNEIMSSDRRLKQS